MTYYHIIIYLKTTIRKFYVALIRLMVVTYIWSIWLKCFDNYNIVNISYRN